MQSAMLQVLKSKNRINFLSFKSGYFNLLIILVCHTHAAHSEQFEILLIATQ